MVAPCCRLVYDKYLNADQTLNEEKLQISYKKNYNKHEDVQIITEQHSYQPEKTGRFKFLKKMPAPVFYYKYKMIIDEKEIVICNCDCHVIGLVCLH